MKENGHPSPEQHSDRSTQLLRTFLGNKVNINLLTTEGDADVRPRARRAMQGLNREESANAANKLISGIARDTNENRIEAASYLLTQINFLKVDPELLKNSLITAVTEETPSENVYAILQASKAIAPVLYSGDNKRHLSSALNEIQKKVGHSPEKLGFMHQIESIKRILKPE